MELSDIPGVAAWRKAYRAFGIKKTSYRCSVERLVKNVLAGRGLPRINGFVDAYNAVSLAHVRAVGADDLDRSTGDLAFRYSRTGDSSSTWRARGASEDPNDPPKPGEVVYADAAKVLCRRWNWRQDARSLVTPLTRGRSSRVQSNGAGDSRPRSLTSSPCSAASPGPIPASPSPTDGGRSRSLNRRDRQVAASTAFSSLLKLDVQPMR